MDLSPATSGADATDSFAAIAERVSLVSWTFPDFYREVTSPDSELHAFISGDVRDIECYLGHWSSLLMCVHIQNQRVPIVWLRAKSCVRLRMRMYFP
ncbi:hypothetical protein BS47DRAFT_458773 [Hydnum rufescens UP504]|uniref:Uncharacterized protein n=1 Tax=Hydnum rufescens UP504 TaxID=1448309 RepID=A0A9P6AI42_9AGAM|nr:hypothetical protein BS47DRAFT_458773 [Hydnum rufescens UP504]